MPLNQGPGSQSPDSDLANTSRTTSLKAPSGPGERRFGYRWTICGLVFLATTVNYIDRQVLGILAPTLTNEFGWSEIDYATIISWFSFAYAFGYLLMGRLSDVVGVRRGYALSILGWSVAAMAHAFVRTVTGFSLARAALGFTEGGNFPAAVKTMGEWFPKKERAFATGLFNAGCNVGAIIAPIVVPWMTLTYGWQEAFIATGSLGFLWVIAWWMLYRDPEKNRHVTPAELAYIRQDPPESKERIGWLELLTHRQTWAYMVAKILSDPVWWFYLYWLPKFLDSDFGVTLAGLTAPLIVVYAVSDVGSIAGGWTSGFFLSRGWSVNRGRKIAMLIGACMAVPTMFAPGASSMWVAVALVAMAAAAQQWWSANLFTTVSDMFPPAAVASVVGLGGFVGGMGAVVFQRATGYVLQATNSNYTIIFIVCGLAYLVGLLGFHLLAPRMEPVRIKTAAAQ